MSNLIELANSPSRRQPMYGRWAPGNKRTELIETRNGPGARLPPTGGEMRLVYLVRHRSCRYAPACLRAEGVLYPQNLLARKIPRKPRPGSGIKGYAAGTNSFRSFAICFCLRATSLRISAAEPPDGILNPAHDEKRSPDDGWLLGIDEAGLMPSPRVVHRDR